MFVKLPSRDRREFTGPIISKLECEWAALNRRRKSQRLYAGKKQNEALTFRAKALYQIQM